MEYPKPRQWDPLSWVPIIAGLYWLLAHDGAGWLIFAVVPGAMLLASGVSLLLTPGDSRTVSLMSAGAVIGLLFTLPAWAVSDFGSAFFCGLLSFGSFLAAGRAAVRRAPLYLGATAPDISTRMDIKVATDEAVLGYFVGTAKLPSGDAALRTCEDSLRMEEVIKQHGWHDAPAEMHPAPPAPDETYVDRGRIYGAEFEILRFDSAYVPPDDLPNATTWKSHVNNAECHVRMLRHPGKPRPWLLCIHGYRMGTPWMDMGLFSPRWLHQRLGLNIIQPVLPLHGPRKISLRTGDHYLDGDLTDLVYAESQALWDLRRTLAWLRQNDPGARVGVYGISLGGYNAALLSGYDADLDFVIAGIPVVDLAQALWSVAPPAHRAYFAEHGLDEARYRSILKPVSPLSQAPLIDRERLFVVAATADRIVVPAHPLALSQHWNVPVQWYQGSHLSVRGEHEVRDTLKMAMSRANWAVE
ncbi:alpha/beta hydrolase family protein [Solimonas marina]|uniref:Prolyl oligopeptidase family serine peptidase n=1 Tax=Solimonas marina TaxID=2714601 RepID=A0A969WDA4_9GAMM|nr:prolyl oligopeptidase family serine peptidase [Solimonas marina]NKF24434.1 prolyl oligopeptidase family serine peptidase [Solimonas marina]